MVIASRSRHNWPVNKAIEIPIFPLDTVLFPGTKLPLRIFEVRYVDMTKACIRDDSVFGVCQIMQGQETGTPAACAPLGCTARILDWEVPGPGLFSLTTEGANVFRILDQHVQGDGLIVAQVLMEDPPPPQTLAPEHHILGRMVCEIIERIGTQYFMQPLRPDDAMWVGYRLAEVLPLSVDQKLRLLQERSADVVLEQIKLVLDAMRDEAEK